MKHAGSMIALVMTTAALGLQVSCGSVGNGGNSLNRHQNPGGDGASEEKALPELASDDLKIRAFEELMRTYRTAGFLVSMPAKPDTSAGCLTFKHSSTGPALRVYYDCSWPQTLGGQALLWNMKSQELFTYPSATGTPSSAMAELTYKASRPAVASGAPVEIFSASYHRYTKLTAASSSGERDLSSTMTVGAAGDSAGDYWESTIGGRLVTITAPMQLALSGFEFTYRPAAAVGKHTYTKVLHLVPKTITTFDGTKACRRPLGTFDWTVSVGGDVTDSGTIIADQKGMTETSVTPGKLSPWPSSCLEFAPSSDSAEP